MACGREKSSFITQGPVEVDQRLVKAKKAINLVEVVEIIYETIC